MYGYLVNQRDVGDSPCEPNADGVCVWPAVECDVVVAIFQRRIPIALRVGWYPASRFVAHKERGVQFRGGVGSDARHPQADPANLRWSCQLEFEGVCGGMLGIYAEEVDRRGRCMPQRVVKERVSCTRASGRE